MEATMNRPTALGMIAVVSLCLGAAFLADDAYAQEKQRVVLKPLPENSKITDSRGIDVGDACGTVEPRDCRLHES